MPGVREENGGGVDDENEGECLHRRIHFGSGDYYIFCDDCPRRWVAVNDGDQADPNVANKGAQALLSGQGRVEGQD